MRWVPGCAASVEMNRLGDSKLSVVGPVSAVAMPGRSESACGVDGLERDGVAVNDGDGGRLSVGKLDGEAQAEWTS